MAVLTIARELGAVIRGEELTLCAKLNLRCVNKSTLEERFAALGIPRGFFARFDECNPGMIGALTNSAEYYWETLRSAVIQELQQDNVAFIGRGVNFLLLDVAACLRVRLIAPEDFRVQQVAREYAISDAEARKMVHQSDSRRSKFCEYYYGKNWRDPANYDLVVNMETISMEELADLLYPLLPGAVSVDEKAELELIVQAQLIKHTLLGISELQLRFPGVSVDALGTVTLHGTVASEAAKHHAGEVVKKIPGVTAVNNELGVILNDVPTRLPMMMH